MFSTVRTRAHLKVSICNFSCYFERQILILLNILLLCSFLSFFRKLLFGEWPPNLAYLNHLSKDSIDNTIWQSDLPLGGLMPQGIHTERMTAKPSSGCLLY